MLTRLIESSKLKCSQYWPSEKQMPVSLKQFIVNLEDEEVTKEITTRRISVKNLADGQTRQIVLLHYTEW